MRNRAAQRGLCDSDKPLLMELWTRGASSSCCPWPRGLPSPGPGCREEKGTGGGGGVLWEAPSPVCTRGPHGIRGLATDPLSVAWEGDTPAAFTGLRPGPAQTPWLMARGQLLTRTSARVPHKSSCTCCAPARRHICSRARLHATCALTRSVSGPSLAGQRRGLGGLLLPQEKCVCLGPGRLRGTDPRPRVSPAWGRLSVVGG